MAMKKAGILMLCAWLVACQPENKAVTSSYTGNETTYDLQPASAFAVSGTITFKQRKDGKVTAVVQLNGTSGDRKHPVHLHRGDITTADADVALLLNPVLGSSGISETTFNMLADESPISYDQLTDLAASIKIHLGDVGDDRNVILVAGNIGSSFAKAKPTGRQGIATCKSE